MEKPDLIEVFPHALPAATCAAIIEQFESSGQAVRGATGSGVDLTLKDSWDIGISGRAEWGSAHEAIQAAALVGLRAYVLKHRYTLLAPLLLKYRDADSGQVLKVEHDGLDALPESMLMGLIRHVFRPGAINLQKYVADQGGYPYWHCEHYPRDASAETLHRALLYSIYLNEGFAEGETDFFYQQRSIQPQTGTLLIAPAFFTHTHRGNRPRGGNKYIATSWILFNRAEQLFA